MIAILQIGIFLLTLGSVITLFLSPYYSSSFSFVWFVTQIITWTIGAGAFGGRYIHDSLPVKNQSPFIMARAVMLPTFAAAISSLLAYAIIKMVIEPMDGKIIFSTFKDYTFKVSLPASVITPIIAYIVYTLKNKPDIALPADRAATPSASPEEGTPKGEAKVKEKKEKLLTLSYRSQGEYRMTNYKDILYLSAHSTKTIIHTGREQFVADHLLKDISKKLPGDKFMRIHKKYTVNISKILRLQYLAGGAYQAFLNDEDDTQVTVGRSYVKALKSRLKI